MYRKEYRFLLKCFFRWSHYCHRTRNKSEPWTVKIHGARLWEMVIRKCMENPNRSVAVCYLKYYPRSYKVLERHHDKCQKPKRRKLLPDSWERASVAVGCGYLKFKLWNICIFTDTVETSSCVTNYRHTHAIYTLLPFTCCLHFDLFD